MPFNPSLCDRLGAFVLQRHAEDSGTLDQADPHIGYAGESFWVVFDPDWEAREVLIHSQDPCQKQSSFCYPARRLVSLGDPVGKGNLAEEACPCESGDWGLPQPGARGAGCSTQVWPEGFDCHDYAHGQVS